MKPNRNAQLNNNINVETTLNLISLTVKPNGTGWKAQLSACASRRSQLGILRRPQPWRMSK